MRKQLILFILTSCLLFGCSSNTMPEQKISDFTFTNQNGEDFGTNQLSENIWVANFIFTNCDTVCDPMTAEMAILRDEIMARDLPIQFVSFSVDPEIDTPETLRHYIQEFTDDLSNWNFLTGYKQQEIEQFAREQFNTIVQKPSTSTQVIHGSLFYLIDGDNHLLGEYNFVDPTYKDEMIAEIKKALK